MEYWNDGLFKLHNFLSCLFGICLKTLKLIEKPIHSFQVVSI